MANFTPRLTAPSETDKRWINTAYGGYNRCINVGGGSVIPNCTGYVHGRWMEIGNTNTDYNLSLGNANTYYSHADGYERGQEPRLGAIAVYTGGDAGHVCVVEEIVDNNTIICSESDYSGARFSVRTRYRQYGWRQGDYGTGGFAGFIYHPDIEGGGPSGYSLSVIGGTSSGFSGNSGDTVTITANKESGKIFTEWQLTGNGTIGNIHAETTTFTFGDGDATITAIFRTAYKLTLHNAAASKTEGVEGDVVTLTAKIPYGYFFKSWKISAGIIGSIYVPQTTYTFVNSDADITAVIERATEAFPTLIAVYHKNKY